jgi:hypothetical protein
MLGQPELSNAETKTVSAWAVGHGRFVVEIGASSLMLKPFAHEQLNDVCCDSK